MVVRTNRFFESAVYREDALKVLEGLDGLIAPTQTLCDSPRESKKNDEALEGLLELRRFVVNELSSPELTDEAIENIEQEPPSPGVRL